MEEIKNIIGDDVWNIIEDYKECMESKDKYDKCLEEMKDNPPNEYIYHEHFNHLFIINHLKQRITVYDEIRCLKGNYNYPLCYRQLISYDMSYRIRKMLKQIINNNAIYLL